MLARIRGQRLLYPDDKDDPRTDFIWVPVIQSEVFCLFLKYLLRRNAIRNGRRMTVRELADAFSRRGIDASGLLTVPKCPWVNRDEARLVHGVYFRMANTAKGINSIQVSPCGPFGIIHSELCRVPADLWVGCFLKAIEQKDILFALARKAIDTEREEFRRKVETN